MMHALQDILLTAVAIAIYLLPAILADRRKRRSVLMLALFNVLFGWTIVGWFAALHWALHPDNVRKLKRVAKNSRRASTQRTISALTLRARKRGSRSA